MNIMVEKMRIFVDVDLPAQPNLVDDKATFYPDFLSMAIYGLNFTLDSSMDSDAASAEIASLDLGPDCRAVTKPTEEEQTLEERKSQERRVPLNLSSSFSMSSSDSDDDEGAFSFSSTESSEGTDEAEDEEGDGDNKTQSEVTGASIQQSNHQDMRMPFDRDAPFTPLSKKADRARRIRSRRIAARGYGNDSEDEECQTDSDALSGGSHARQPTHEGTSREEERRKHRKTDRTLCHCGATWAYPTEVDRAFDMVG